MDLVKLVKIFRAPPARHVFPYDNSLSASFVVIKISPDLTFAKSLTDKNNSCFDQVVEDQQPNRRSVMFPVKCSRFLSLGVRCQ